MDSLLSLVPAAYIGYVSAVIAVCAVLATALPAPAPGSTSAYAKFHAAVNFIAMNFGKAKNAEGPALEVK